MKEWFEGFIANGLQFRLGGSKITAREVSYKILVKNISNKVVSTTGFVHFNFDNDERKIQIVYAGIERYEDVWRTATLKNLADKNNVVDLEPGQEYFFNISCCRTDVTTDHDFLSLKLKMNNFMQITIKIANEEDGYAWWVSSKKLTERYGEFVQYPSCPNTEEEKLALLVQQDYQLEKEYGVRVGNCNVCKHEDGTCDIIFELKEETGDCVRNLRMVACVYNRKEKPIFLQSLDICGFENFNIYTIKNLPVLDSQEVSKIFVFPTKL